MALVLALLFRARLRLLPLGLALCAVAIVFGGARRARAAADDGLDRGAAGADGVGGRLRRPVPGAGGARWPRWRRPRWRRAWASSSCCCRRCRWCAGSARCWWSAWRVALVVALTAGTAALTLGGAPPARSDGDGRALAARRGRARRRGARGAAARRAAAGAPAVRSPRARRASPRAPCTTPGAGCSPSAPPRVLVVAARWRSRLGAGRADRDRLRPPAARAAGPRRGARPRRAAARHGRRRRGRRARRRQGPDRPEGDRVDARLPGRHPDPARLRPGQGLRGRRAVSRALAARPLPHARAVGHARADPRAAGRRAGLLLAGRDHARPAHRRARVRHPAAVAGVASTR